MIMGYLVVEGGVEMKPMKTNMRWEIERLKTMLTNTKLIEGHSVTVVLSFLRFEL